MRMHAHVKGRLRFLLQPDQAFTMFLLQTPEKDEYSRTRQQMTAHIDVCMGGRVAEELIFGAEQVRPCHLLAWKPVELEDTHHLFRRPGQMEKHPETGAG